MTWCPRSVSGMHLPAFAAAEGGLFAEQGLQVEFVPATRPQDYSVRGFTARVKAVGAGQADFALTSVVYLLAAQTEAAGSLPVRFVATAHQRNPIAGVVREDSGLRTAEELAGARTARWSMPWFAQEYAGALDFMGLAAPVMVDTPGELDPALGSGDVDVLPVWIDDTTQAGLQGMRLHHRGAAFDVRAIALDIPVYTTGLVAADRMPSDVLASMRDAYLAGYHLQRAQPELGLAGFRRCFPSVSEEYARANWALFEPYAFDGVPPGSMNAGRWQETIAHTAKTHGLSTFPGDRIHRPEMLTPAPDRVALGERPERDRHAERKTAPVRGHAGT
ncbi:MAG: ABC transporter substrate-binding protein [Actinomycetota bacterium]|nr:ABC transporter substrate-binding protein [Actinomycetota bacterium]